jgi:hypothetical protein
MQYFIKISPRLITREFQELETRQAVALAALAVDRQRILTAWAAARQAHHNNSLLSLLEEVQKVREGEGLLLLFFVL